MDGSSPLARGTRPCCRLVLGGVRLIPARAGNTPKAPRPRPAAPAHPRSRGEHACHVFGGEADTGSSPLARGTQISWDSRRRANRLIPARAGNTVSVVRLRRERTAHPRSRGEHTIEEDVEYHESGSSPLARGTHQALVIPAGWSRLIPARAGNTAAKSITRWRLPAHPRSRGEHPEPRSLGCHGVGSSPLARGTPGLARYISPPFRLIPARAGNTLNPVSRTSPSSAHPRSRGEHPDPPRVMVIPAGSSPLARGTPPCHCRGRPA